MSFEIATEEACSLRETLYFRKLAWLNIIFENNSPSDVKKDIQPMIRYHLHLIVVVLYDVTIAMRLFSQILESNVCNVTPRGISKIALSRSLMIIINIFSSAYRDFPWYSVGRDPSLCAEIARVPSYSSI